MVLVPAAPPDPSLSVAADVLPSATAAVAVVAKVAIAYICGGGDWAANPAVRRRIPLPFVVVALLLPLPLPLAKAPSASFTSPFMSFMVTVVGVGRAAHAMFVGDITDDEAAAAAFTTTAAEMLLRSRRPKSPPPSVGRSGGAPHPMLSDPSAGPPCWYMYPLPL